MLGIGPRRILGLAIGEQEIRIAEIHVSGGGNHLARCAGFALSKDAGWDRPEELGQRLRDFLRQQHFTAHHAVVGLPGRWVLLKPRMLPPAAPAVAVEALRLTVEREYQADAHEWVFDFAGEPSPKDKASILLAATPRQRLMQVAAALEKAELRALWITSTTLSLALADANTDNTGAAVLHLSPDGAELAIRSQGRIVTVERLSAAPAVSSADAALPHPLAGDIRRILTGVQTDAALRPQKLTVWSTGPCDARASRDLGEQVGLPAHVNPSLQELGVLNGKAPADADVLDAAGAVALAVMGTRRLRPCIDFVHPRLTAQKQSWLTRPRAAAAALVLLVLGAAIYLGVDWYLQKHAVDQLQAELAAQKDTLTTARFNVDRFALARGWYDARPPMLDCAQAVTLAFPISGQVWATSLAVRDDLSGTLAGKSQEERGVFELLDRLRASKRFSDVKLLYLRQPERGSRVVSFALSFAYTPPKPGRE